MAERSSGVVPRIVFSRFPSCRFASLLIARSPCWLAALLVLGATAAPGALAAQDDDACPRGRISSVFVDNHSVFDTSDPDLNPRLAWAYGLANRLHIPTREAVIRGEILVREGDCYDPELLRESERVLRASSFLADVDVYGIPQPDGTHHVLVDTQDEWSMRVEARTGAGGVLGLQGIRLRDDNVLGYGRRLSAFYLRSWEQRVYGVAFATPQLWGSRWDAGVAAGKTATGSLFSETLAYPFIGESGRWALRQQLTHEDRFFTYAAPRADGLVRVLLPERRRSFDVGSVYRFGRRGNLTLVGAALAGEWIAYPLEPRFARERDALAGDSLLDIPFQLDSVASVRAMLLAGKRNVRYVRRRALDTVHGTEDLRLGVEAEVGIGSSIPGLSDRSDRAVELGLTGAIEPAANWATGGRLLLEGKRDYGERESDTPEWRDLYAQFDGWSYWRSRPDSRHTYVGAFNVTGGWNTTVPFQLTLGSATGLRGYDSYLFPGAQRLLLSLERRSYLGWPYPDLFDLGAVTFVDVGRIWKGDAKFGTTSPFRADVGVGLRAALPPGSRNTVRIDLAVPVQSGISTGDVVLSVGIGQAIGVRGLRKDPQLLRSSRQGISTSLFTYPN